MPKKKAPIAQLPATSPVLVVKQEPPPDEIDKFTKFIARVWRPWLGFMVLIGWTWMIVGVHVIPYFANYFLGKAIPKPEGYTDSELQWLSILTGIALLGRGWELIQQKQIEAKKEAAG